jgi:PDZ domain-containing protein
LRRWGWSLAAVVALLAMAAGTLVARGAVSCEALAAQPSCYVAMRPGPSEDVLRLLDVRGARAYATSGELLFTTVAVDEDLGLREWLAASMSGAIEAVPRAQVFPVDRDREEVTRQNAALMADSQLTATMAALERLGYDLVGEGARVAEVVADAVTYELRVGDVITAVDDEVVTDSQDAVGAVQARRPGERVVFSVRRDGDELRVPVRLGAASDDAVRPYVGVLLTTDLDLPVDIVIDAGVVGGPSAGLMFALSIIELLGPDDLADGRVVAGTGTLARDGQVGAVGGVRQKVIGATQRPDGGRPADVFLVPRANLADAQDAPIDRPLTLVPVDDLDGALAALAALREGREPAGVVALGAR